MQTPNDTIVHKHNLYTDSSTFQKMPKKKNTKITKYKQVRSLIGVKVGAFRLSQYYDEIGGGQLQAKKKYGFCDCLEEIKKIYVSII